MAILPDEITADVLRNVAAERLRQYEILTKHEEAGRDFWDCADPHTEDFHKVAVLVEEVGEVARAMLEISFRMQIVAMDPDIAHEVAKMRQDLDKECVQVAAVAVAIVESLRRA